MAASGGEQHTWIPRTEQETGSKLHEFLIYSREQLRGVVRDQCVGEGIHEIRRFEVLQQNLVDGGRRQETVTSHSVQGNHRPRCSNAVGHGMGSLSLDATLRNGESDLFFSSFFLILGSFTTCFDLLWPEPLARQGEQ